MPKLDDLKMKDLRKLGDELGVKAASKKDLLAEIREAQAQLKQAETTEPDALLENTEFEETPPATESAEPEMAEAPAPEKLPDEDLTDAPAEVPTLEPDVPELVDETYDPTPVSDEEALETLEADVEEDEKLAPPAATPAKKKEAPYSDVDLWIEEQGNNLIKQHLPVSSILLRFIGAMGLPRNGSYRLIRAHLQPAMDERRWNDLFHGAYDLLS